MVCLQREVSGQEFHRPLKAPWVFAIYAICARAGAKIAVKSGYTGDIAAFKIENDFLGGVLPDERINQKVHGAQLSAFRAGGRKEVDEPAVAGPHEIHSTNMAFCVAYAEDLPRLPLQNGAAELVKDLLSAVGEPKLSTVMVEVKLQKGFEGWIGF